MIKMVISNISPGNEALEFIDFRVKDEKYRGYHSSQHNRYNMNQIIDILTLLDKYAPNISSMIIRTTDISKRAENTPDEVTYAQFCNEVKEKTGIGTQDAMRKNLFVDLHRMGLIERYDKNKNSVDPFKRQCVKCVSLSSQGLKLTKAENISDKFFIFSKGIDTLLGGRIEIILDILRDEEYKIKSINLEEYIFFISAIGIDSQFNKTTNEAVELIKKYRNLTSMQRKSVMEKLKTDLDPKKFKGSKLNKRDFHNWLNEAQQVFYLLNQTVYFEVSRGYLVLTSRKNSFSEEISKLNRSLNEKYLYFNNHKIKKTAGFELHHVVPLARSENVYSFKLFDKWENMVYIDGYNHAKITQNRYRNIILSNDQENIKLADYSNKDNVVYLKYNKNILYDPKNKEIMQKYNYDLRNDKMTPKQNIDKLRKFYPFVEKNRVMGMGKSGKFYAADLDGLESYILTKSGAVLLVDGDREIIVQSYPKLEAPEIINDIPILNEKFIAEYKVDGHNVRLLYLRCLNNFVALQRGGFICAQTTTILREAFSRQFINFFSKYPYIVLCMEVIGKKSLNATNYEFNEKNWGFGNVGYFIFDVFNTNETDELGKWYDNDFLNELKEMDLSVIPQVGIYDDGNLLVEKMAEIDQHFDGVVLKSMNQRDREHIYKLRWEYFVNKFQDKIKIKDKGGEKSEKDEHVILSHFFQGYPQPELGLNEGISAEELKKFEKYIDELDVVVKMDKANIKNKVGEITDHLIKILVSKGNFDKDMQNKLLKGIKNRLGGFVGRGMSKEDRENKKGEI